MPTTMHLKYWLLDQGLPLRELALELEEPLKTARGRVYRGVLPWAKREATLTGHIMPYRVHHWVIPASGGPASEAFVGGAGIKKSS